MNHLIKSCSHSIKKVSRLISLITLLLFLQKTTNAISKSHKFGDFDHTRYSIEQIPGEEEIFAVGTSYRFRDASSVAHWSNGIIMIHLDATTGNVITSNEFMPDWPSWAQGTLYYKAIDVVPEYDFDDNYTGHFWLTAQVKEVNNTSSLSHDYIYVAKIDATTCTIVTDDYIKNSITDAYKNLYPTHSVFHDEGLFICGYATMDTEGLDAGGDIKFPFVTTTDKKGMILKYDVNTSAVTYDSWNTVTTYLDYDMALKMVVSDVVNGEILVTGAANHTPDGIPSYRACCVFARRYLSNLTLLNSNSYISSNYAMSWLDETEVGMYGIDILQDNFNVYILVNEFTTAVDQYPDISNTPYGFSWGILQLKPNLELDDGGSFPPANRYVHRERGIDAWAKQFFYENGDDFSIAKFRVLGEQAEAYCQQTINDIIQNHSPSNIPTSRNINPFITYLDITHDEGMGIQGISHWHKIHLSRQTVNDIYLNPFHPFNTTPSPKALGTPQGTSLTDIRRLYTFGLQLDNNWFNDIVLLHPIYNEITPSNIEEVTKFLRLNNAGDETECWNQVNDCNVLSAEDARDYTSIFENSTLSPYTDIPLSNMEHNTYTATYDCDPMGDHVYKPGKTTSIEEVGADNTIFIYPNPTTTKLNIKFGSSANEYAFILTDVAGKVVVNTSGKIYNNTASITLPQLTHGMYFATVHTGGKTHTEKVIIE